MNPCPNHQGNFDCTPFCNLCEGEQELEISFPVAFEYQCWKCDKWHESTSDSIEDLSEFVAITDARLRFLAVN